MKEILEEIRELKAQQRAMNNLVIENGKRNEMVITVLRELLLGLNGTNTNDEVFDTMNRVFMKLEGVVELLSDKSDQ